MSPFSDPFVFKQTSFQASLLVRTAGFPVHEFDDLCQELLLDLLRRSRKFNPERGGWPAFVRGVTRHQTSVLCRQRNRRARWEILAAELLAMDEGTEDDCENILEGLHTCDGTDALLLGIDVRSVLGKLPCKLQVVARLLCVMPVEEVCLTITRSRSRVYDMRRELQRVFRQAGLGPER